MTMKLVTRFQPSNATLPTMAEPHRYRVVGFSITGGWFARIMSGAIEALLVVGLKHNSQVQTCGRTGLTRRQMRHRLMLRDVVISQMRAPLFGLQEQFGRQIQIHGFCTHATRCDGNDTCADSHIQQSMRVDNFRKVHQVSGNRVVKTAMSPKLPSAQNSADFV
jgi:hypothetical protein